MRGISDASCFWAINRGDESLLGRTDGGRGVNITIIEAESDFVSDVGNLNDKLPLESSKRDVLKLSSGGSEISQSSTFVVTLNDLAESIDSWATTGSEHGAS